MTRRLGDTGFLHGLNDPGGESLMTRMGVPGWVSFTAELAPRGESPNPDFTSWTGRSFGVMVCLVNGDEPEGTIPVSSRYGEFARRCAAYVKRSRGCHIWVIGNEMNFLLERPAVRIDRTGGTAGVIDPGEVILPAMYATCYRLCRSAIRALPGHADDQVLVGAVATWMNQTAYPSNPHGDWVLYFRDLLEAIGPSGCDGFTIHTATPGPDPALVRSDERMGEPFSERHRGFRSYRDYLGVVPEAMRRLPAYLTAMCQQQGWVDANSGWVRAAYAEIDAWNHSEGTQVIRSALLHRWRDDRDVWGIRAKPLVQSDFMQSLLNRYGWEAPAAAREAESSGGDTVPDAGRGPDDDSPLYFPETGKTAPGAFAAFFRRYGAEITGRPITEVYRHPISGLPTQDWEHVVLEEHPPGVVRLRAVGREMFAARAKEADLAREVEHLRGRLSLLETATGALRQRATPVQEPAIRDITETLPRDARAFVARPCQATRLLVIHHTGTRPEIGPLRVANAHRKRWPGTLAHYFIDGAGAILRTNPEEVACGRDPEWIYTGLHLFVAGRFDASPPLPAQLDALARLCAWLLATHDLPLSAIVAAGDYTGTTSPGKQWAEASTWRRDLLSRVSAILRPDWLPEPTEPAVVPAESQLRRSTASVQAGLAALQAQIAQLAPVIRLPADDEGEKVPVPMTEPPARPNPRSPDESPHVTELSASLPRHPSRPYDERDLRRVPSIVIHHSATPATTPIQDIAAYQVARGWPGIGYHFVVCPDGSLYQTAPLAAAVNHAGRHNASSIALCLLGNFIDGLAPPPQQLDAAGRLAAHLIAQHGAGFDDIVGHQELDGSATACPGTEWLTGKRWKTLLLAAVTRSAASEDAPGPDGAPEHYYLFWRRGEAWAREEWAAATNFLASEKPSAGFSLADALRARHVTIVGGYGGVPYEVEQALLAAGRRVDRLAVQDLSQLRERFDALARLYGPGIPAPAAP